MEETRKAGKKSNIEINEDKGAKQNSHPGREEWPHLIRIGVMVFVTFAVSILFSLHCTDLRALQAYGASCLRQQCPL